ncbi:MAG: glycosyltransferase family 4 protein [Deltaproteobacteria bacterium]|nr:glycosyltransferase family 4 protein [Deltaproteobacteria bacterium]
MKRICYLTNSLNPTNGWGRFSTELIYHSKAQGVEPLVVSADEYLPTLLKDIEVLRSPTFGKLPSLSSLKLHKLASSCDLVHCLTEPLIPTLNFTIKPFLINLIGTYCILPLAGNKAFFYRRAYRKAAKIISISNYTAKQFIAKMPEYAAKLNVIPLGVSNFFLNATAPDLTFRKNLLLLVGHVKPRKGLLELLLALKELKNDYPQLKLHVAGPLLDSQYLTIAQKLISDFGLEERVVFLSQISDLELLRQMSEARALVVPSTNKNGHFEGFGLVHLEAHALGTPSIGSLDCGNEDVIKHDNNGYLTKQQDTAELIAAIKNIFDDKTWLRLSSNAKLSVQKYSWTSIFNQYLEIYESIG